jgi:hypothetical protein
VITKERRIGVWLPVIMLVAAYFLLLVFVPGIGE